MVATVVCRVVSARCLGQCLEPSGCKPESAGSWLLLQGLTLFPRWMESTPKEVMCAKVSERTLDSTEHLMEEAEEEFYVTYSIATH